MTAQPVTFIIGYPPNVMHDGDIVLTWCSRHMERTSHVYTPGGVAKLVCLDCHPEYRPSEPASCQPDASTPQLP